MRRLEKVFGRKMIVTQIFPIDKYKIIFYNWKQFLARGLQFQHGQYFAVSCFLDLRLPFNTLQLNFNRLWCSVFWV